MESDNPVTERAARLSIGDRQRSEHLARRQLASGRSDEQVTKLLIKKGLSPEQAQNALAEAHRFVLATRPKFVAKQRKQKAFAIVMIVFGIALFVLGLAVGRPQTLIISVINVGVGLMSYSKVLSESFASFVKRSTV